MHLAYLFIWSSKKIKGDGVLIPIGISFFFFILIDSCAPKKNKNFYFYFIIIVMIVGTLFLQKTLNISSTAELLTISQLGQRCTFALRTQFKTDVLFYFFCFTNPLTPWWFFSVPCRLKDRRRFFFLFFFSRLRFNPDPRKLILVSIHARRR